MTESGVVTGVPLEHEHARSVEHPHPRGVLLDPMRGKALQNQFLVTLGLSLLLTNAAQVTFSPDFRTIQTAYGQEDIQIGPAFVPLTRIFTFAAAVAATGLLLLIFQKTRLMSSQALPGCS